MKGMRWMGLHAYFAELGETEYRKIFDLQLKLNAARRKNLIPDTVLVLAHHPCFTVGRKGGYNHILVSQETLTKIGIRVYETDRGGDITYHGPGQVICYPIIDLRNFGRDVHQFAHRLEEAFIRTLAAFGIEAGRKQGFPGVWVGNSKIAAEGIAIERWVTMHGIALNVNPDLNHFALIVPCGLAAAGVTSMEKELGRAVNIQMVRDELRSQISQIFDLELENISRPVLEGMIADAG